MLLYIERGVVNVKKIQSTLKAKSKTPSVVFRTTSPPGGFLLAEGWTKMAKKVLTIFGELVLLFLGIALILFCMFMVWETAERPPQGLVPEYQRIKIEKYCAERKIRPSVIEILPNGRMFYDLNGKRCEIK